jgi:reductive dehalogenase
MKAIGLSATGAAAIAGAGPVFHDLDEVVADNGSRFGSKHPWFVKELDHEKPSSEIDWSAYQQIDGSKRLVTATSSSYAEDYPVVADIRAMKAAGRDADFMKEKHPTYKDDLRDYALSEAGGASRVFRTGWTTFNVNRVDAQLDGPESFTDRYGNPFPKWNGTPEENTRMISNVVRFFGGGEVGILDLTPNVKKLIYKIDRSGYPIVYEDVDDAYMTDDKKVIPTKCSSVITWTSLQPTGITLTQPAGANGSTLSYTRMYKIAAEMLAFMHAMGFQHVDGTSSNLSPSAPFGMLSGVGEHSRACMNITSWKYGNTIRGMNRIVTDMPLAPTKPIDAGVFKFCQTCGICAEACPYDSMPRGKSRWDSEWDDENQLQNYIGGFDGFRLSLLRCPRCRACQAACVFNSSDSAIVHSMIRGTVATTSIFNGFFTQMHKTFGYDIRNPNDWWEHDVPMHDWDPAFINV